MTAPAAIQGDYCDLKFVKGRKVCQITVEIPIEAGAAFVAAFGTPDPANGVPVALARLGAPIAERKGGKLAQRAGILCNEGAFRRFLAKDTPDFLMLDTDMAAEEIRFHCGVGSRAELDHNPEAARKFADLVASYDAWMRAA